MNLVIALCIICSIILVPAEKSVKADGTNKRDELIKSVSLTKSNGQNVAAKENYNEQLNYFLEVAFEGNTFQKGDYFDVTLSEDALLYTEASYDLKVDVDASSITKEQVVGKVTVRKVNGSSTLHFSFTEDSDPLFIKGFTGNFKIQVMPAHGNKNFINLSYGGSAKNFNNIGTNSVELNVDMASDWPPIGSSEISKISGDLYHAMLVYEKPKSKVNYETEILVSYPLFEKQTPLGNVQNIKIEIWDEARGGYRTAIASVDYGPITYDVGTPFVGGPAFKMDCTIPFKGISTKTRVSFDIDTNVDGKAGTTDPYLISISSVESATKSLQFYPVNNASANMNATFFGKITTRFEDELGNVIKFDDYSDVTVPGKVNPDDEYEITERFLYNSVQNIDKHLFDTLLNEKKYKLLNVTSPNMLSETSDNLSIQIKQGYQNDVLYRIKKLQKPVISALPEIEYSKTVIRTTEEFLTDVQATTDIPADLNSDLSKVKWGVPGNYPVIITAVNDDNQSAEPFSVTIKIAKNPAPVITVDSEITYDKTVTKDESELLNEVNARTNDGSAITSDVADKVKWGIPGDYEVTLNAVNEDGVAAETKKFIVHILKNPAPVITVDPEITYDSTIMKEEKELLQDVHARTNDSSHITSDMQVNVNWRTPGSYTVTLNAVNEDGIPAESVQFIVNIVETKKAPIVVEETSERPSKPKVTTKQVVRKGKLPETGDTNSKALLSGILCLGAWFLLRQKRS